MIDEKNQEYIGEFIGIFAADGNYFRTKDYHHRIFLFFGPDEVVRKNQVKHMLKNLFWKEPSESKRENLLILSYCSKKLYDFIQNYLKWDKHNKKTYSVCLKDGENTYSKEFMIGFLRGNLDSDGYISKEKICFSSVSKNLILNLSNILKILAIKHSYNIYHDKRGNRKPIHNIIILKMDQTIFLKLINPRKRIED